MSASQKTLRRPALEQLERREVMTGNIQAALVGDDLQITGDDRGNGVLIYEVAPNSGHYRVEGLTQDGGATRINGQASMEFRRVWGDLKIDLHGGDDLLQLGKAGVQTTNAKFTSIETGYGSDVVDIAFSQLGKLSISTGIGDDVVRLTNDSVRYGADIDTANGDDTVQLTDTAIGYGLDLNTGDGSDLVSLLRTKVGYDLTIKAGEGDDRVNVSSVQVGQIASVQTMSGNDHVSIDGLTADGIYADLGDGPDSLSVSHTQSRYARFDGGNGSDRLQFGAGNQFKSLKIENFER